MVHPVRTWHVAAALGLSVAGSVAVAHWAGMGLAAAEGVLAETGVDRRAVWFVWGLSVPPAWAFLLPLWCRRCDPCRWGLPVIVCYAAVCVLWLSVTLPATNSTNDDSSGVRAALRWGLMAGPAVGLLPAAVWMLNRPRQDEGRKGFEVIQGPPGRPRSNPL